jgi:serine/threonine-protein kinase
MRAARWRGVRLGCNLVVTLEVRPAPKQCIGPYRIDRRLATGGSSEVYLARLQTSEGIERTVVVKRLRTDGADDEDDLLEMFLDEARLMARMAHPHIVQVFDAGRDAGGMYLAMEYVHGVTLARLLEAGPAKGAAGGTARAHAVLPERDALGIVLAVAEALAYVHELRDSAGRPMRIVHRDLNPANVLVGYTGSVKLIDFGIAKAASRLAHTSVGFVKGTVGYIAPEALDGVPLDHRADVYALGLMLYELTVGRHPFEASDPKESMRRAHDGEYPRPRALRPDYPPALDRIVARCLAPHPSGRYDSMREVVSELAVHLSARGLCPTMTDLAALVHARVPDPSAGPPVPATAAPREGGAGAVPDAPRAGSAPGSATLPTPRAIGASFAAFEDDDDATRVGNVRALPRAAASRASAASDDGHAAVASTAAPPARDARSAEPAAAAHTEGPAAAPPPSRPTVYAPPRVAGPALFVAIAVVAALVGAAIALLVARLVG